VSRTLTDKDLAYENISQTWERVIANYDTRRRIEVLVDEFLGAGGIRGKTVLEAGCGLGEFTTRLHALAPARLASCDIAPSLVEKVAKRFPDVDAFVADLLHLGDKLQGRQFEVVFSSEVIEHTPDPRRAVEQLAAAVAPGGLLVLSVPNRRWIWLLHAATAARLRPHYQGYENWVGPGDLLSWIESAGLKVERSEGIHLVPWQFLPKRVLRRLDRTVRDQSYPYALNLAVVARRPAVGK
jgi:2-polyprenyl-6-hydroxyphenyl methylase/3-demethylubiquinone-9 3-methyltransferase